MRDRALTTAIKILDGTVRLAALLGISSQAVSQWDRCPVERVLEVERATGGKVSRHELRPDIYPKDDTPALTGTG